jgi:hypothetical protein
MAKRMFKNDPLPKDRSEELEEYYQASKSAMQPFYERFDDQEAMLISRSNDNFSKTSGVKSQVNNGRMATLVYESSARVMAQMPTGRFQAMTRKDKQYSEIMQVVWDRYVTPKARSQYDLLTKYRLWNVYSKVYGSMPVYYDWVVSEDYVGPDLFLVPIRNFFPQPGKLTMQDSDWTMLRTVKSVRWLESRRDMDGWKKEALNEVLDKIEGLKQNPNVSDSNLQSFVERNRSASTGTIEGKGAQVELVTYYEAGKEGEWITCVPEFGWKIVCEKKNPHKNGRIPVVMKHCFPLIDSMIGLGDFERGKTLQYASNSLLNMYLDTVKMGLYPPLLINPDQVGQLASIQWGPAAKWLVKNPQAVTPLQMGTQGLNTFQSTWEVLNASILNLMGTTDTTVTQNQDAAYGKTPAALEMQQGREAARDNWDRFFMEQAIEEWTECGANLFAEKHEVDVDIPLMFADEIKRIGEQYADDLMEGNPTPFEVYDSEEAGNLALPGGHLKGVTYHFSIDASSSLKRDQMQERQVLTEVLTISTQNPLLMQSVQQAGFQLNMGELFKRWLISGGVEDVEKILTDTGKNPQTQMATMQSQVEPQGSSLPPVFQPGNSVQDPNIRSAIEGLKAGAPL